MKTLYLSITGILIGIIAVMIIFVSGPQHETQTHTQNINCKIYHSNENYTTTSLAIEDLNDTYNAGCPITATLHFLTHQPQCQLPQVFVTNLSTGDIVYGPNLLWNYTDTHCSNSTQVSFYAGLEKNQLITDTQKYKITATVYDRKYQREFTVIPSEYSGQNITADTTLLPGSDPWLSCPAISGSRTTEEILDSSGFDGVYPRYLTMSNPEYEINDYFLKPGSSGKIIIKIHPGSAFHVGQNLASGELILNKNSHYGVFDHYGVSTSYEPDVAMAGLDGTTTLSLVISTTKDAAHGTYWLYLPPGGCVGGKLVLLTIGDRPIAQPPDLIGYVIPVGFSFSESPILTTNVMAFGIHTFDNCSLSYIDNNKTEIIKSFDEIPPGFVYKYHFGSNPVKGDKVEFECKKPYLMKSSYSPD